MKLSPLDIQHMAFDTGFSGYNKRQVRECLEQLADQTEELLRNQQKLLAEIEQRGKTINELRQTEAELKRAVTAAERIAHEMKQNAKREAELTLRDAEQRKEGILRETQLRYKELTGDLVRLERERDMFREQFRGMLHAFERSLDASPQPQRRGQPVVLTKAKT